MEIALSEATVIALSSGIVSVLFAVIGVFLFRLLTQLDANSALTSDIGGEVRSLRTDFERIENDIIEARKLQTEFAILRAEFHIHKKASRGNGKYAETDDEH